MLDEMHPDDRPAERTHIQPREHTRPAEKIKASPEAQSADNPAPAPAAKDIIAAPGATEPAAAAAQTVLGPGEPALVPDIAAIAPPGGTADDESHNANAADGDAPNAPAMPQSAVIVPPAVQAATIPTIHAGLSDPSQTAAAAASPDAPAIPAPSANAGAAAAQASPAPAAKPAPAIEEPANRADTKPGSSPTRESQPKPATAATQAESATPELATRSDNPEAAMKEAAETTGTAKAQAAEAGAHDSAEAELNDNAAPADKPQHAKPPQTPPARTESPSGTSGQQADIAAAFDDTADPAKSGIEPPMQPAQAATPIPAHAATTHALTPQTAPVSAAQPIPVNAIAVEIAAQARAGNSRFEIRLDPPELGRIDVRLDIDNDGNVKSRLIIERTDTYDLLRRDQSTLERALNQAGLKTSDNALEFSLRDQGFAQHRDNDDQPRGIKAMVGEAEIAPSEAANGYARLLAARGGLDIRV
ncbi:MAG: flagellar hook-length control protein FliK [Pseudomonadota bacterium]